MRGVEDEDLGCAYPLEDAGGIPPIPCGAARQPGSSFCPAHHVLCHIPAGSMAECRTLDEAEALARVVGGRLGRELRAPPRAAAAPPRPHQPAFFMFGSFTYCSRRKHGQTPNSETR